MRRPTRIKLHDLSRVTSESFITAIPIIVADYKDRDIGVIVDMTTARLQGLLSVERGANTDRPKDS